MLYDKMTDLPGKCEGGDGWTGIGEFSSCAQPQNCIKKFVDRDGHQGHRGTR